MRALSHNPRPSSLRLRWTIPVSRSSTSCYPRRNHLGSTPPPISPSNFSPMPNRNLLRYQSGLHPCFRGTTVRKIHGSKHQPLSWPRAAYRRATKWSWVWKLWILLVVWQSISLIISLCNYEPNARERKKIRDKLADNARIESKLAGNELSFDEEEKWLKIKARNQRLLKQYNQRLVREVMAEMQNRDEQPTGKHNQGQSPAQGRLDDPTNGVISSMTRAEDFNDMEESS